TRGSMTELALVHPEPFALDVRLIEDGHALVGRRGQRQPRCLDEPALPRLQAQPGQTRHVGKRGDERTVRQLRALLEPRERIFAKHGPRGGGMLHGALTKRKPRPERPRAQARRSARAGEKLARDQERLFSLSPGGSATRPLPAPSAAVVESRAAA